MIRSQNLGTVVGKFWTEIMLSGSQDDSCMMGLDNVVSFKCILKAILKFFQNAEY